MQAWKSQRNFDGEECKGLQRGVITGSVSLRDRPSLQGLAHIWRDAEIDECVYAEDHAHSAWSHTSLLCFLWKDGPHDCRHRTCVSDGNSMTQVGPSLLTSWRMTQRAADAAEAG